MSDRRRNPGQDDWEDDLDLAGFDRPASPSRAPNRAARYPSSSSQSRTPDPYIDDEDFLGSDPYGASSRQQSGSSGRYPGSAPAERSYPSNEPYPDDRYGASPDRQRYPDEPYPSDRYGQSRSSASSRYGSDFTDAAPRRAPSQRTSRSRQAPPAVDMSARATYGEAAYGESGYPDEYYGNSEPAPRASQRSRGAARPRPSVAVPKPAINDGVVVAIVAASLLSIVFMVASIAAGGGDLPDWFPIHLDASGNADLWGDKATLWRIPLGALMTLIMALVVAALLWKRDRFAARFAIVGTAAIQVLAWVALIDFIW